MAGKTAEERIAAIDEKIAKKQAEIEALELSLIPHLTLPTIGG